MTVHSIAAIGLKGQIGLDGKVPWHGDSRYEMQTKADLAMFAKLTEGHVILMGRKTAESLPRNFRPGSRKVLVLSRAGLYLDGDLAWTSTAFDLRPANIIGWVFQTFRQRDLFVCGGQEIYELFAPFVDWHHISVIPYDGPADRHFPPFLPKVHAR